MEGRFSSLDQTHLECESTLVEIMYFRPRKKFRCVVANKNIG